MKRQTQIILFLLFSLGVPLIGYLSFGITTALIFLTGFLGGYILWLITPNQSSFKSIKFWYCLTFFFFIVHRVEENVMKFQIELSKITGVPVPEVSSLPLIILLLASVGSWLIAPYLIKRGYAFGYYLAWTFFASMGITELAHFFFPFFTSESYDYFPGMASVILLAPIAWYGMWKLSR